MRSGPQTKDQSLDNHYNKSLVVCTSRFSVVPNFTRSSAYCTFQVSSQHQHPVRVIRGYKLTSRYKSYEGFRYDGLYTVHNVRDFLLLVRDIHQLMIVRCYSHGKWSETMGSNNACSISRYISSSFLLCFYVYI